MSKLLVLLPFYLALLVLFTVIQPSLLFVTGIQVDDGNSSTKNGTLADDSADGESRQRQQRLTRSYSHTFTNVGEYIYLQSESYPYDYDPNSDIRYTLTSPRNTQIRLECPTSDFNVEPSSNCVYDRFMWSLSGDDNFQDGWYDCGSKNIDVTSSRGRFTVRFTSNINNPPSNRPWRYRCKVTSVPTPCSCGVSGATGRDIEDEVASLNVKSMKIVGGVEAKIAEFPWRVALYENELGLFCAGSLISPNWVLTAAHCTANLGSNQVVYADIGDHNVREAEETQNRIIRVDRIIQNSRYNDSNYDSDICLLHLSEPVQYSRYIQPLCLPWKYTYQDFQGSPAVASGWGTTFFGGTQSDFLRRVDLDVLNNPTCKKAWAGRLEITETQICAEREGKDTCQADSGGSLDYRGPDSGRYYGLGIVSHGVGCAQKGNPGIYTQIVNFLGWIEQNSNEDLCKA